MSDLREATPSPYQLPYVDNNNIPYITYISFVDNNNIPYLTEITSVIIHVNHFAHYKKHYIKMLRIVTRKAQLHMDELALYVFCYW